MIHPIKHFKTITKHRMSVCRYCFKAGLYYQGLTHDLSKYSPVEFNVGAKYYQGDRSPNAAEREATGYSRAWLHHKGRNKHHFEYWIDYTNDHSDPRVIEGQKMPRKYVAEMVFDMVSASKTYKGKKYEQGDAYKYYGFIHDRMWFVHPDTNFELGFLLKMWADKGEDATISYIRNHYLKGDDVTA